MASTLAILKIIAPVIESAFAAATAYYTYKNIKNKFEAEKQED